MRIFTFLCVFGVTYGINYAQEWPVKMDFTPPSPNASALAKYGDIPISNYTGIPKIDIPIYTISTKYLSLPVSLSYHAGGVRVEETASSVGLSWSLNAGGIISRTVMGLKDEKEYKGFIRTGQIPTFNPENYSTYINYQRGLLDGQADIFNYNFGDYVGKFVIDKSHEIAKAPWSRMKLDFVLGVENNVDQILKWTAIGEDGTKYEFEGREYTTILETVDLIGPNPPVEELPTPYVSSWYITKITSANGLETYTFQYEPYTLEYYQNIVETNYSLIQKQGSKVRSKIRVQGQRLISITFPNGQINLQYYGGNRCDLVGDKALEKIIIQDGDFEKEFQFGYSYFDQGFISPWSTCSGGESDLGKRLRLDYVVEDPQSESPKKHSFEYNEDSFLPNRFSSAQDHWGYYNGKTTNTTLIPIEHFSRVINSQQIQMLLPGADRNPHPVHVLAGTIKKIIYPTGGYTQFEFGINDCQTTELPNNAQLMSTSLTGITPSQQTVYVSKIARPFIMFNVNALVSQFADPLCYLSLKISGNGFSQTLKNYYSTSQTQNESFLVNIPVSGSYTISVELSSPNSCTIDDPYGFSISWENEMETITKLASGLRVNKITDYPLFGLKKSKFFKYEMSNLESSGAIVTTPKYGYFYQEYDPYYGNFLYYVRTQFTNNPLVLTNGGVVGYSRVLVADDSLCANGYTELIYTNPEEFPDNYNNVLYPGLRCLEFPFAPAESNEWKRGLLLSKSYFKKEGSAFKVITREVNEYGYEDFSNFGIGIKSVKTGIYAYNILENSIQELRVHFYAFKPHKQYLYRTILQTYQDNVVLSDTTTYFYNNDKLLSYSQSSHQGKIYKTKYYYPSFYKWNSLMDSLVDANIINQVITTESWIETSSGNYLTSAQTTEFTQKSPGVFHPKAYWSFKGKLSESTVGTPSQSDVVRNRSLYERYAIILKRDGAGNVTELLDRDSLRVCYIWDFAKRYPVAKIVNAETAEVYHTSFEEKLVGGNVAETSRTGSNSRLLSGSSYPITSLVTPKVGKDYVLSYWWKPDLQSEWQLQSEAYSNFQSGAIQTSKTSGYIDELRFYPQDAEMSTFTHRSGIGVSSITDSNNVTVSFEYDDVGRLKCVRDEAGNILSNYQYRYVSLQSPY